MKKEDLKTQTTRKIIELVPDDKLVEVAGGRSYGWEYGGWIAVMAPPPSTEDGMPKP